MIKTYNFPKIHHLHKAEELVRAQNIDYIQSNEILSFHTHMIEKSMDLIDYFSRQYESENDEQKTIQILGLQIFNQSASALKLILSGYYHASISVKRSLLETMFLLDYFSTDKTLITEWNKNDRNSRTKGKFNPMNIRKALDNRDGFTENKRNQHYNRLCELGTHPTPVSFVMLKPIPEGDFYCGPFFAPEMIKGSIEELVLVAIPIAENFSQFFKAKKLDDYRVEISFMEINDLWNKRFYKTSSKQTEIDELKKLLKLAEQNL
jgi:hypothetical protein